MSISKAQAIAIGEGFLNTIGEQKLKEGELPVAMELLKQFGLEFITTAQKNLKASGSIASGNISDIRLQVTKFGTLYTLSLGYPISEPASKYYDYVNKGVKGTANIKADSKTPYSFKTSKKSVNVSAIEGWLKYNKLKSVSVKPYRKLGVETKAIESKKSLAFIIARSIHRKGMKSTHYFDNAQKAVFGKEFAEIMSVALGKDIQIKIKQIGKEITNGNNNTK